MQSVCGTCGQEKMARSSFPKASEKRSKAVGDLMHIDLSRPLEVPTPSGNRYCLVLVLLIDDYSCYTVVYLLRCKFEAFDNADVRRFDKEVLERRSFQMVLMKQYYGNPNGQRKECLQIGWS